MKKVFLFSVSVALSLGAFAQKARTSHTAAHLNTQVTSLNNHSTSRTTVIGGTDTLSNIVAGDTAQLYYAGMQSDSGFISGTDAYGDMGFAERFDFNGADSLLKVTGVIAVFGGTVNSASTKTVTFYTWAAGPQAVWPSTPYFNSGLPAAALDSVTTPLTGLNITPGFFGLSVNTFTTPTAPLSQSFFVGYTVNYDYSALAGDTIGVATTQLGNRISPLYTTSGTDTIINNQNVTMYNDGSGWHDNGVDNFALPYDLYLFPIVQVLATTETKGITRNDLTFFGNYPNPATDNTNIKFSLANGSDVTVTIMDMAGHTINTIQQTHLSAGEHIVPVNTSSLSSGDYLYLVHTASGAGIAGKMTIAK